MDENVQTEISLRLLITMVTSGLAFAGVYRKDATLGEAQNYAYGNTLVFEPFPGYGVYLLVMTQGTYIYDQVSRYQSGLWATKPLDTPDDITDWAYELISRDT